MDKHYFYPEGLRFVGGDRDHYITIYAERRLRLVRIAFEEMFAQNAYQMIARNGDSQAL